MPGSERILPTRPHRQGGFTLVEILVAAVILGMTISGVTSLMTTGRTLDSSSRLRSQALSLAANTLERPVYNSVNYPAPVGVTVTNPTLTTESGGSCQAEKTDSVYLPETIAWTGAEGGPAVTIPYQKISVKVVWTCGGITDSLYLRKRIADILKT